MHKHHSKQSEPQIESVALQHSAGNAAPPPLNNEIKSYELEMEKSLATGAFGYVNLGTYKSKKVAIKGLLKYSESGVRDLLNEARLMNSVGVSDFIVKIIGVCPSPTAYIVMEYMAGGNLSRLLAGDKPISWEMRYRYALQIAQGLEAIHENGIVHRDLKGLNILLSEDLMQVKICDFGIACSISTLTAQAETSFITAPWIAPECLKKGAHVYSQKSDIYSYGMILFELATRERAYSGVKNDVAIEEVKEGKRPTIPTGPIAKSDGSIPKKFAKLIELCWAQDPEKRPDASQIVSKLKSSADAAVSDKPKQAKKSDKSSSRVDLSVGETSSTSTNPPLDSTPLLDKRKTESDETKADKGCCSCLSFK